MGMENQSKENEKTSHNLSKPKHQVSQLDQNKNDRNQHLLSNLVASPPPVPPKPSASTIKTVLLVENSKKRSKDVSPPKKNVSLLTQQIKNQNTNAVKPRKLSLLSARKLLVTPIQIPDRNTLGNFARNSPLSSTFTKPLPTPPTLKSPPMLHSSHGLQSPPHSMQFGFSERIEDTSDGDSNFECYSDSEEECIKRDSLLFKKSNRDSFDGELENKLIEQVQINQSNYAKKQEELLYMGMPGSKSQLRRNRESKHNPFNLALMNSEVTIKSPPPPPPSKRHSNLPINTTLSIKATSYLTAPLVSHSHTPTTAIYIPGLEPEEGIYSSTENSKLSNVISPDSIASNNLPQLPPRPSLSTLARAHSIVVSPRVGSMKTHSLNYDYSYSPSSLSDEEVNNDAHIKRRSATLTAKRRAKTRSELFVTRLVYPDFSRATRSPPINSLDKTFYTGHKTALLEAFGNVLVTASGLVRIWDIHKGISLMHTVSLDSTKFAIQENPDVNYKIRALITAPSRDPKEEGRYLWVAQDKMLSVLDLDAPDRPEISKRSNLHTAPILFLLRYRNTNICSIDQRGDLYIWDVLSKEYSQSQDPLNVGIPRKLEVTPQAVTAIIDGHTLWISSGRNITAHIIPVTGFKKSIQDARVPIRIPNDIGNITKLLTIPCHPDRIFASHNDGKISIWDTKTMEKVQIVNVSMYGICTMVSVGEYQVWAGYNTGMIYVYDTRPEKWIVLKMWKAHTHAISQLCVDANGLIFNKKHGRLQVVSSDTNGYVGIWDGLLTEHWKDEYLEMRAKDYCTYSDVKVMVCSWNVDANKPEKIDQEDRIFVREWLGTMEDPDIISVGIQEIVDLESKKQTARSLFFKKKPELTESDESLTNRYKLWLDFLAQNIADNYGKNQYTIVKTDRLVGLFSCIFVRTSETNRVLDVDSTTVKTGLKLMKKSIHGNKGGIAIRFVYDHSSLCFLNCHLAAGQSHVQQRNADVEGIIQSANFSRRDYANIFSHGGDGSMVLDHEYCFLSGDLNYRINKTRSEVLRILTDPDKNTAWRKLKEQDQLLRQRVNNPLFKLLTFEEAPIKFDPTYKYDRGTNFYDRSEKRRIPAWCDRILYKGNNIENLFYRRFEPRCSDHRPISAGFSFKTKTTDDKKRNISIAKMDKEWGELVDRFVKEKKANYIADFDKCSLNEAIYLLEKSSWNVKVVLKQIFDNE